MFRRTKKRPKVIHDAHLIAPADPRRLTFYFHIQYVFVTGGFSLNEYVRAQLQESLEVVILPKNIA